MKRAVIFILFALTVLIGCKKEENNPVQEAPQNPFTGTWQILLDGDYKSADGAELIRQIDGYGNFQWFIKLTYRDNITNEWLIQYFNITGNVSSDGSLLAQILTDDSAKRKVGTFSGRLNDKNGSGTLKMDAVKTNNNCTWIALKK